MNLAPQPNAFSLATQRVRNSLDVLGSRVGRLFNRRGAKVSATSEGLLDLAGALLSLRGKASGPSLASTFFDLYEASDLASRQAFLSQLHAQFQRDKDSIDRAIAVWREQRNEAAAALLSEATESPLHSLIRQLNLAPGGTARLIAMREDLLGAAKTPGLQELDREFEDVFESWFNAGFLELRRIGWDAPAAILERIIKYEAVHSIHGWDDLRRRVEPADRRCYGFFHPQMADDPLIFVEVALTDHLPTAIAEIISEGRETIGPQEASYAIFYSISNCQEGLRGIPFGNFLIKQVVGLLKQELPQLRCFATLSPVPGFAKWLARELGEAPTPEGTELRTAAARYLVEARSPKGGVADPVARFHLGNGARLEAIHLRGDLSAKGLRQSHGVMVNYLYDLDEIEANLLALSELDRIATSERVQELLAPAEPEGGKRKRAKAA
ncbi:MAG: malonyl-CoA decarboxylase family protein [Novosphingobium sp.]